MELSKIYDFGSRFIRGEVQYEAISEWDWNCSADTLVRLGGEIKNKLFVCRMLEMGSYEGVSFPLEFRHLYGKRYYDILCIGCGSSLFLVSDRFLEVLETNHFTGWKSYPVRLFEKNGTEVFGYNGFSVTGKAGKIDWEKSEVVQIPGPIDETVTYPYYKGALIDMSEWDGSDIFMPSNSWRKFITESVYKALKKAKMTNIKFEKATEILRSV